MRILAVLLLSATLCFAQYEARYAKGRLVGLFNLTEPVNCGLMKFNGPVKSIRSNSPYIYFSIRNRDIEFDASDLSNVDRSNLFESILKPGRRVSISGYACGSNGMIDPLSISLNPR
jgi:hypothetical protein